MSITIEDVELAYSQNFNKFMSITGVWGVSKTYDRIIVYIDNPLAYREIPDHVIVQRMNRQVSVPVQVIEMKRPTLF